MNILIVEDNRVNRLVAKRKIMEALKMHGLEERIISIDEAQNGADALGLVASKSYDLIYMDYNMPGMNGDVLTAKIREIEPSKSVIFTCSAQLSEKIPLTDFILKKLFTKQELLKELLQIETLRPLLSPISSQSLQSPTVQGSGTQLLEVIVQAPQSPSSSQEAGSRLVGVDAQALQSPSSSQGVTCKLFPPVTHSISDKNAEDFSPTTRFPAKL